TRTRSRATASSGMTATRACTRPRRGACSACPALRGAAHGRAEAAARGDNLGAIAGRALRRLPARRWLFDASAAADTPSLRLLRLRTYVLGRLDRGNLKSR